MDLLVPEVISLILKLGAMMVLMKAGFMSLCHSLEERMALCQPPNNLTMTCTGGIGHALSSCLLAWHWGLVRNIWRGGPNELHQSVRILLQFTQFCIRRQVRHAPYRLWEHVPPHVWTDQSNSAATQDEAEDKAEVCVLCCQKRSTVAVCTECKEHYCIECIDTHNCGTNVVC